jgi:hypothetical protein
MFLSHKCYDVFVSSDEAMDWQVLKDIELQKKEEMEDFVKRMHTAVKQLLSVTAAEAKYHSPKQGDRSDAE